MNDPYKILLNSDYCISVSKKVTEEGQIILQNILHLQKRWKISEKRKRKIKEIFYETRT
jgi:hypothetical protein